MSLNNNRKNASIGISLGILLHLIAFFINTSIGINEALSAIFVISGYSLLIWGCCLYIKEKGYSGAWAVLGLLGIIGIIILFFFKDKKVEYKKEISVTE